jgi:glutamate racemase
MTAATLPEPTAPLLLFDSGVGGLSVLRKVRAALPQAPAICASVLSP